MKNPANPSKPSAKSVGTRASQSPRPATPAGGRVDRSASQTSVARSLSLLGAPSDTHAGDTGDEINEGSQDDGDPPLLLLPPAEAQSPRRPPGFTLSNTSGTLTVVQRRPGLLAPDADDPDVGTQASSQAVCPYPATQTSDGGESESSQEALPQALSNKERSKLLLSSAAATAAAVPSRRSRRDNAGRPPQYLETEEISIRRPPPIAKKGAKRVEQGRSRFKDTKIPAAPSKRPGPDWDDARALMHAICQLPAIHLMWVSDELAEEWVYTIAGRSDDGFDGTYQFLCVATSLLNRTIPAKTMQVAKITEELLRLVDMIKVARLLEDNIHVPGEAAPSRRTPIPAPGTGNPLLDEYAVSELTIFPLAGSDPKQLEEYYESHGIHTGYLDLFRLPADVLTSDKPYSDTAWFETVQRAHRFLSNLFCNGLSAPALRCIRRLATSTGVTELHPADARVFLEGVFPGRFQSALAAGKFVKGMVEYAHKFNHVCPDFLFRYFPGPLLGVFEFWMEETFADSYDSDRPVPIASSPALYNKQVQRVIERARTVGAGYMSFDRLFFDNDNEWALLHLGGHYTQLV
jgi:hypothetical protein